MAILYFAVRLLPLGDYYIQYNSVSGVIAGLLPVAIYFAVRRLPLGDAATIFFSGKGF